MVSIIPGIENLAPERTDTSSGFSADPSSPPVSLSSRRRCVSISFSTDVGTRRPRVLNNVQTPVETVKPGGTGSPAFVISARPAPLPPSRSRIERSPSALPPPKK